MKPLLAALLSAALVAGAAAREEAPAVAPTNSSAPVLNGEATRTVWGFEVYKIRLYLHEVMRSAEKILGSKKHPKRIEITMTRAVDEEQFTSTVQESIDNNFTPEEKENFSGQLSQFLGCFNHGAELKPGNVITIEYTPADGTVVQLDGRTLDTIPGADFYHALLRLWIGKPLQKSIKDGLVGAAG
ncbi:MAG: chalcone isomerase family protein [Chthoniobacterales bacterium]|nr:chalcone isomerase family protein [Chthoniobacterales bacterium]